MRYRILTPEGIEIAREALNSKKRVPNLSAHEVFVGSGDILEEGLLDTVAGSIRKRQRELLKEKGQPEDLDRLCFELVHSSIPRDELLLGDTRFWLRFAVTKLDDVIVNRFPGRKGLMNLDNFGLGARRECWPYKLWVRGEVSYDENAADHYKLGRYGGVDIWTSHVHRQNFMAIRTVFRGVFAFQYPKSLKGKPLLFEGEENPKKGGVLGFRTLIKRLCENWASVEYICLSDSEVAALIGIHSKGLHRADDKSVLATP